MGILDKEIQQNIQARKTAEAIIQLLDESLKEFPERDHQQRVLEIMTAWIWERLINRPRAENLSMNPMSESQALAFENQKIGFGKYQGETIGMIPLDYLTWISDQQDTFKIQLKQYFLSERGKRRLVEDY